MLILVLVLSLAGCARKSTVTVTAAGLSELKIVSMPAGAESVGYSGNSVTMTLKKDGEYPVTFKDEDGTEHTFTVQYENGIASVMGDEEMNYIIGTAK